MHPFWSRFQPTLVDFVCIPGVNDHIKLWGKLNNSNLIILLPSAPGSHYNDELKRRLFKRCFKIILRFLGLAWIFLWVTLVAKLFYCAFEIKMTWKSFFTYEWTKNICIKLFTFRLILKQKLYLEKNENDEWFSDSQKEEWILNMSLPDNLSDQCESTTRISREILLKLN